MSRKLIYVGHFLWMQGLGSQPNATNHAETPRFNQDYSCFKFYYHMYGSDMGQLRVLADVDANYQEIWSMSGEQ